MGEAEYNRLLETVGAAMTRESALDFLADYASETDDLLLIPVVANDNDGAWPHFEFPDGWTASC
jgi:3-hydroxyacyl-CoA dehydrogenase